MTQRVWGFTALVLIALSIFLYGITYLTISPVEIDMKEWHINAIRLAAILIGSIGLIMFGNWLDGRPDNQI